MKSIPQRLLELCSGQELLHTDRQTDGWTDRRTDGQTDEVHSYNPLPLRGGGLTNRYSGDQYKNNTEVTVIQGTSIHTCKPKLQTVKAS